MQATPLLVCPSEIVCEILSMVPSKDLAACRRTCRELQEIIEGTQDLRWRTFLGPYGRARAMPTVDELELNPLLRRSGRFVIATPPDFGVASGVSRGDEYFMFLQARPDPLRVKLCIRSLGRPGSAELVGAAPTRELLRRDVERDMVLSLPYAAIFVKFRGQVIRFPCGSRLGDVLRTIQERSL